MKPKGLQFLRIRNTTNIRRNIQEFLEIFTFEIVLHVDKYQSFYILGWDKNFCLLRDDLINKFVACFFVNQTWYHQYFPLDH